MPCGNIIYSCIYYFGFTDYLKNERLMFVADRLMGEWRTLGINLKLSMNRMDIIEIELPADAKPDTICYTMLKAWRDEMKGKVRENIIQHTINTLQLLVQ